MSVDRGAGRGRALLAAATCAVTGYVALGLAGVEVDRRDRGERAAIEAMAAPVLDSLAFAVDHLSWAAASLSAGLVGSADRTEPARRTRALVDASAAVDAALVVDGSGRVVAGAGPGPPETIEVLADVPPGESLVVTFEIDPGLEVLGVASPVPGWRDPGERWVVTAIDLADLLERAGVERLWQAGFDYRLTVGDRRLAFEREIARGRETAMPDPLTLSADRPASTWRLTVVPKTGWSRSGWSWTFRSFAVIVALLVGILVFLEPHGSLAAVHAASEVERLKTLNRKLLDEVGESREVVRKLTFHSSHDSATGLPNRELFLTRLQAALHAARSDERLGVAVICIGLDRFLHSVDSMGRHAAKELVLQAARRLELVVSPDNSLSALEGGRFVILLRGNDVEGSARAMADRVRSALRGSLAVGGIEVFNSVSTGTAFASTSLESGADLLERAQIALRHAQTVSSDASVVFEQEMIEAAAHEFEIESDLRLALERDEFRLYFQPVVSLTDGRMAGAEALIRWHHPVEGLLEPAAFMEEASHSGLIASLTRWILKEACERVREWRVDRTVPDEFYVAVNVSIQDLTDADLGEYIASLTSRLELPPGILQLEVTESVLIQNLRSTVAALESIRGGGVPVAVDDFDAGRSSLSYLTRFTFDILKLDRVLVGAIVEGERESALVRSVLQLSTDLGMTVVAEGIETEDQLRRLRELGCPYGQGYYFSPPLARDDFLVLLNTGRDWTPSVRLATAR